MGGVGGVGHYTPGTLIFVLADFCIVISYKCLKFMCFRMSVFCHFLPLGLVLSVRGGRLKGSQQLTVFVVKLWMLNR